LPQPTAGHVAEGRFNSVATAVLVVAVLPLLSRRFFGPASPSHFARSLRVLCGAAVLALVPACVSLDFSSRLVPVRPAYRLVWCIAQGWSDTQGCGGVPGRSSGFRIDQGIAAGVLATMTGALFVTALGTSTVALLLESAGLRHWLSHGQVTAIASYRADSAPPEPRPRRGSRSTYVDGRTLLI
jgi:hypothetical protein